MYCECCGEVLNKELERIEELFQSPGAVFLANDSPEDMDPYCWPAVFGLKKYHGCVEWGRGDCDDPAVDMCDDTSYYNAAECKLIFGDVVNPGEAWLVIPHKDYFDWYNVTDIIPFENEDD